MKKRKIFPFNPLLLLVPLIQLIDVLLLPDPLFQLDQHSRFHPSFKFNKSSALPALLELAKYASLDLPLSFLEFDGDVIVCATSRMASIHSLRPFLVSELNRYVRECVVSVNPHVLCSFRVPLLTAKVIKDLFNESSSAKTLRASSGMMPL